MEYKRERFLGRDLCDKGSCREGRKEVYKTGVNRGRGNENKRVRT
jgi:hypothetical protein